MNIGIFSWGSRGDIQPFLGLAKELKTYNHQITFFAPQNFEKLINEHDLNFSPLHGSTDDVLFSDEGQRVLRSGNAISLLKLMQKEGKIIQPLLNNDLIAGCEKVDFIITSVLCHVWISCIAEKMNKKWCLITFSPPTTPTKEFPFAGLAFFNSPFYNLLSHRLIQYLYWSFNKKDINNFRKTLNLKPLHSNIVSRLTDNNILNLYAISPSLIRRPKDWPSNSDIIGYFFTNYAHITTDETELVLVANFLEKGDAPIYIGLGSMPIPNPNKLKDIIYSLTRTANQRVVFCKGWSSLDDLPAHENLLTITHANHDLLLPKCKAAIIHGGAGTIAACLKSKTPMIITSVFGDQPWWGHIIQSMKLGFHIPFKKLTLVKLMNLLEETQSLKIKDNLTSIGDKINSENGVRNAANKINSYFS